MIVRDHLGKLIVAMSSTRMWCVELAAAEALAALEATKFCCSLGQDWVQFAGDAKRSFPTRRSHMFIGR